MNQELIRGVWNRANRRCEYCHMPAVACNRSKGPNIAGRDPETGEIVQLFHPRRDCWSDHFEWDGPDLIGKTKVGRVTIRVLGIDDPIRRDVRAVLWREGSFDWN